MALDIPSFTKEHITFIKESFIAGIPRGQILDDLLDTFDELLENLPAADHEKAREVLYNRIDNCRERHKDEILSEKKALAEVEGGGEDLEWDKVPISRPGYRLRMMMKMLNETPLKVLQKVATDDKGRPYKVYKHLVAERLRIMEAARQEVELLNKAGDYIGRDGKVSQEQGEFGDLGNSEVLGMGPAPDEDEEDIDDVDTGQEAA